MSWRVRHWVSRGEGGMSPTAGVGIGGAGAGSKGRLARARISASWRSLVSSRRFSDQRVVRSEEHTSELQSLMRISYAVFRLKKKKTTSTDNENQHKYQHQIPS